MLVSPFIKTFITWNFIKFCNFTNIAILFNAVFILPIPSATITKYWMACKYMSKACVLLVNSFVNSLVDWFKKSASSPYRVFAFPDKAILYSLFPIDSTITNMHRYSFSFKIISMHLHHIQPNYSLLLSLYVSDDICH